MEGFKQQLKQELDQHVPFTNEIKQRLIQTKRPTPKRNWQVPAVFVAACCMIGILLFSLLPTNQTSVANIKEPPELPIIDVTNEKVINPEYALLIGKQWMLGFLPMVVDEKAPISYGDYVAYYTKEGVIVSTVFGLAKDQVNMEQGQVSVNGEVLKVRGLGEKIEESTIKNPLENPYYFFNWRMSSEKMLDSSLTAASDEFVVYDNQEEGHTMIKINEAQLIGKVVGIQNFNVTFKLTDEEQTIYETFKKDHNLDHLSDVDPLSIAKIYLMAEIEGDYDTYKALFTTVEDDSTNEIRSYNKKMKPIREAYFTNEISRLISAYVFAGLEKGKFTQTSGNTGEIKFSTVNGDGEETSFSMRKNDDGIWQPAFTRAIY